VKLPLFEYTIILTTTISPAAQAAPDKLAEEMDISVHPLETLAVVEYTDVPEPDL
jgi:hypothetical protein